MQLKPALITVACQLLFVVSQVSIAAPQDDRCAVPPGLREEISKKYPGTSLVSLGDLSEYDRKLFQKDHGTRCPGAIKTDFYGDGKPTWALVLISGIDSKSKAELVVGHQVDNDWQIRSLDSAGASVPVVWTEGPGKYHDVYGEKTIQATHPVIVFVGYSGWAVVYAWTGKGIDKVWIAD
jgi:hypothetical protein